MEFSRIKMKRTGIGIGTWERVFQDRKSLEICQTEVMDYSTNTVGYENRKKTINGLPLQCSDIEIY